MGVGVRDGVGDRVGVDDRVAVRDEEWLIVGDGLLVALGGRFS